MQFGVPKEHWLMRFAVSGINKPVLEIERVLPDSCGFPRAYRMRKKQIHGFMTGDIVLCE